MARGMLCSLIEGVDEGFLGEKGRTPPVFSTGRGIIRKPPGDKWDPHRRGCRERGDHARPQWLTAREEAHGPSREAVSEIPRDRDVAGWP